MRHGSGYETCDTFLTAISGQARGQQMKPNPDELEVHRLQEPLIEVDSMVKLTLRSAGCGFYTAKRLRPPAQRCPTVATLGNGRRKDDTTPSGLRRIAIRYPG